jgi:hypothetical protein
VIGAQSLIQRRVLRCGWAMVRCALRRGKRRPQTSTGEDPMTNSPTPKGPARPETEPATEKLTDAMQQGASALMAIPQRMMQANLEAISDSMHFMNRRMKAQAALWSGFGQLTNGSSLSDVQQHVITSLSKEMAAEMQELGDMARRNMAAMTGAFTPGGEGYGPTKSS